MLSATNSQSQMTPCRLCVPACRAINVFRALLNKIVSCRTL